MNKTMKLAQQLDESKVVYKKSKDPNIKGRKYKGSPYLKLKKVKTSLRVKIRQLLRGAVPLEELQVVHKSDQLNPDR